MAASTKVYTVLRSAKSVFAGERWYFTVHSAGNGQVIATSERYHNRADAVGTMALITKDIRVLDGTQEVTSSGT